MRLFTHLQSFAGELMHEEFLPIPMDDSNVPTYSTDNLVLRERFGRILMSDSTAAFQAIRVLWRIPFRKRYFAIGSSSSFWNYRIKRQFSSGYLVETVEQAGFLARNGTQLLQPNNLRKAYHSIKLYIKYIMNFIKGKTS
ncbi:hypothetical protein TNCT_560221 [Trichonephila clavata]|uniref:Uncharacterized protein n=1 Tax=Trichonephila clavata TaxID=2740835 RepID=A0A8X6FKQ5_TRICU|nr:hypothetical protein TNCT_560221 [Trichonephila clavata]